MAAEHPGPLTRATTFFKTNAFRVERRLTKRFSDVELRQLRSLERAYSGTKGPDLLVFGDSAMFWTTPKDSDRRHLFEMIRDELGGDVTFEALVGPGYGPRIIMAFLAALPRCQSRPRVVLVPTSVLMASSIWLAHPKLGYVTVGDQIREYATSDAKRPKKLVPFDEALFEDFDRLPAPSLFGARRTVGELRLITNSVPATRWQQVIRLRHMMDHYNAERLEDDSPGVTLVTELAEAIDALALPSVAYIAPINHEVVTKTLGAEARDHVKRNAAIVEAAYLRGGPRGTVVNATFDSPAAEFDDPIHLSDAGRRRLAGRLADAVRPILAGDPT